MSENIRLTVIYENTKAGNSVKAGWGFACLISLPGRNILFDTGGNGPILIENLRRLAIDTAAIDDVFLSHNHWDHTGGLFDLLAYNPRIRVWLPAAGFSGNFRKEIARTGADCRSIEDAIELFPGVYSTGQFGDKIPEQALVLQTKAGLAVITGCAHPGIVRMIKAASRIGDHRIALALGGFHLIDSRKKDIEKIVAEFLDLGVTRVAPCHCTGLEAQALFQKRYQDRYSRIAAGSSLDLSKGGKWEIVDKGGS